MNGHISIVALFIDVTSTWVFDVNYPALAGGASWSSFSSPTGASPQALRRASITCHTHKILLLHGKFLNADRCVNVSIKDGATIRARPFSIREFQVPIDVSAAFTNF